MAKPRLGYRAIIARPSSILSCTLQFNWYTIGHMKTLTKVLQFCLILSDLSFHSKRSVSSSSCLGWARILLFCINCFASSKTWALTASCQILSISLALKASLVCHHHILTWIQVEWQEHELWNLRDLNQEKEPPHQYYSFLKHNWKTGRFTRSSDIQGKTQINIFVPVGQDILVGSCERLGPPGAPVMPQE